MKYLKQLAVILIFYFAGEALSLFTGLPVPGNIFGLLLLLGALLTGLIREDQIRETGDFLLAHLVLFLIPPGLNLLRDVSLLSGFVAKTILMNLVTVMLTLSVCALIAKFLIGRQGGKSHDDPV